MIRRWGPLVAILVAVAVGLVVWLGDDPAPRPADHVLAAVHASSDAPRLRTLAELVEASDLIVRARVTGTERGRVFGNPGGSAAIQSRVVHLRVTSVLRGEDAVVDQALLVEEEGWTADGAPLVVDGLAPTRTGDDAVWFLARVGAEEEARYLVVSAEGRYRVHGDRLEGASGDDPLVAELAALGASGLTAAVAASP